MILLPDLGLSFTRIIQKAWATESQRVNVPKCHLKYLPIGDPLGAPYFLFRRCGVRFGTRGHISLLFIGTKNLTRSNLRVC